MTQRYFVNCRQIIEADCPEAAVAIAKKKIVEQRTVFQTEREFLGERPFGVERYVNIAVNGTK